MRIVAQVETPEAVEADCLGMAVPEIEDLSLGAIGRGHQQQSEKNRREARRGPDKHRRDGVTPVYTAQLKNVSNVGRRLLPRWARISGTYQLWLRR